MSRYPLIGDGVRAGVRGWERSGDTLGAFPGAGGSGSPGDRDIPPFSLLPAFLHGNTRGSCFSSATYYNGFHRSCPPISIKYRCLQCPNERPEGWSVSGAPLPSLQTGHAPGLVVQLCPLYERSDARAMCGPRNGGGLTSSYELSEHSAGSQGKPSAPSERFRTSFPPISLWMDATSFYSYFIHACCKRFPLTPLSRSFLPQTN